MLGRKRGSGDWEQSRLEAQTPKSMVPAGLVKGGSLLNLEREKIDQLAEKIFSFFFFGGGLGGNVDKEVGIRYEKETVSPLAQD